MWLKKNILFPKYLHTLDQESLSDVKRAELQTRFDKVESLLQKFKEDQDFKIETFEDQYYAIVAKCKCILEKFIEIHNQSFLKCNIKLPTYHIVTFLRRVPGACIGFKTW